MSPKFFPRFFRTSRDYAAELPSKLTFAATRGESIQQLTGIAIDAVMREAIEKAQLNHVDFVSSGVMSSEGFAAQSYSQYMISLGAIYDIDPFLVGELKESEGDEITISDLKPPQRVFYLHFGSQSDIVFNDRVIFEGAFILVDPLGWRITICGRREGHWWDRPADVHTLRLPPEVFQSPINDAIEESLRIDFNDLVVAREALAQRMPSMSKAVDVAVKSNEDSSFALKRAMNLCAQTLAYMTSYHDDMNESWQDDTPLRLREKAESAPTKKERDRSESKLRSMGFERVCHIGKLIAKAQRDAISTGTMMPHTRRAHWRNQAHGPHMSLRKLIWIHRMRVMS
jgi:hypothetical protein